MIFDTAKVQQKFELTKYFRKKKSHMRKDYIIQTIVAAIYIAILVWMLQSCNTPKPVVQSTNTEVKMDSTSHTITEVTTNETIKESDVAQSVDVDSAYAALQLSCDSLGNVLINALEQEQGKRIDLELQLKNNILQIKAIQEEFEVIVKGLLREKEVLIKENTELRTELSTLKKQEKQEPIEIEKPIPAVVKWFAWIGVGFVLYYVIRFALWVYRKLVLNTRKTGRVTNAAHTP